MPACIFETGSIRANIAYLTTPAPYGAIIAQGVRAYFSMESGLIQNPTVIHAPLIASPNPNPAVPPELFRVPVDWRLMALSEC